MLRYGFSLVSCNEASRHTVSYYPRTFVYSYNFYSLYLNVKDLYEACRSLCKAIRWQKLYIDWLFLTQTVSSSACAAVSYHWWWLEWCLNRALIPESGAESQDPANQTRKACLYLGKGDDFYGRDSSLHNKRVTWKTQDNFLFRAVEWAQSLAQFIPSLFYVSLWKSVHHHVTL